MANEFGQQDWDRYVEDDCRRLVRLAVREDLGRQQDWTTVAIVPPGARGAADVVVRQTGVVAGLPAAAVVLDEMDADVAWNPCVNDGDETPEQTVIARIEGSARDLLTCERPLLNMLGRLSGIATLTARYVKAAHSHRAAVFDTRKTAPGWRRLEKYAVRRGGGTNHRIGLFDAVMIKDNHIAFMDEGIKNTASPKRRGLVAAVERVRAFLAASPVDRVKPDMVVEIEVDSLSQLREVLTAPVDVILLDNMDRETLYDAVALRNELAPEVILEASGGVNLATIGEIAATGVDRISIGALTHSAPWLDIGLDWRAD